MTSRSLFSAALLAGLLSTTAVMADIMVKDAYARSATPNAKSAAAFMMLMNRGDTDDRLIGATSDVSKRVELHTHTEDANGVMRMGEIEGGIDMPAGGMHQMKRGGDHVMFMGLTGPLVQDTEITVTLTFEKAGDIEITIPVDNARKPAHGSMDHGAMDHSDDS